MNRDFVHAHEQLFKVLKSSLSVEDLKESYDKMIAAYDTPPSMVDLTTTMEIWPDKRANDVGWAYVTIAARDWGEGITVVVANESDSFVIRTLEWGRYNMAPNPSLQPSGRLRRAALALRARHRLS